MLDITAFAGKCVRTAVRRLSRVRILVGRDPQRVNGPALILFPLQPALLCCGLAGIVTVRRPASPGPSAPEDLPSLFGRSAVQDLAAVLDGRIVAADYLGGRASLEAMDRGLFALKGEAAFAQLFFSAEQMERLSKLAEQMRGFLQTEEALLEEQAGRLATADLEAVNRGLVCIRDLAWGLERDILANVARIAALAGADRAAGVDPEALPKYRKLNALLNCLDRLEVRGRDSAGIEISFVPDGEGGTKRLLVELAARGLEYEYARRTQPGDLVSGSIACAGGPAGAVVFTYKTASIIGELGRNVRELRQQIAADSLLRFFTRLPVRFETAFAHTRWASVGSITAENCHPLNNFTLAPAEGAGDAGCGRDRCGIHVALNGDIDNYQRLREALPPDLAGIAPEVTTDTKIIPLQIERHLQDGFGLAEAFRRAVSEFEGSHAIAMVSDAEPGRVFLALRGSGQSIYVGIAPDRYLFSSELYGLVEETPFFVKMDGEKPSRPDAPRHTGQIFILDQESPGGVEGIRACFYDGTPLALDAKAVSRAEITTRDIDRGDFPHFFLKEISEAANSVRKTLRGRYRVTAGAGGNGPAVVFNLGEDVVPQRVRDALTAGRIRRMVVIGHGTAAVAGEAVALGMAGLLQGSGIRVEARVASELSGFELAADLSDTLVIPITQSGTTTDTNRAVAMAGQRGAAVIAVVNRRQSDITTKSDGVFYTSDGRDIEMSVASTKAFYSQIVAGGVLALFFARLLGTASDERIAEALYRLEQAPGLMRQVLARREEIRLAVEKAARRKRYWAIVGSGPNKVAADEIRIKLSELCYKTISSDIVENKKHIDLSAEPLIVVCAAGSPEAVTGDAVKDVAIFKAHKSSVVVFADEGESRFDGIADAVIPIPRERMPLPVILNTLAGHLFGYWAACGIDAEALFLREFKSRLNLVMVDQARQGMTLYESVTDPALRRLVNGFTVRFNRRRSEGAFTVAGVQTIADLALLLKYATGKLPLDDLRHDFPAAGDMASPIDLLDAVLGRAVDELARPIDAIRHQAKTVTVGTSRKEEPPAGVIADLLRQLAYTARSLSAANLPQLGRLQRAVLSVNGHTLYAVSRLDAEGQPGEETMIAIADRGGVSVGMRSRAETPTRLIGTKKGIVASGRLYVGQGKSDGAPIVILPLLGDEDRVDHLLLLHVTFNEQLSLAGRKEILGERVAGIRDLIQEVNLPWQDDYLGEIPLGVLLGEPVEVVAACIRERLTAAEGRGCSPAGRLSRE